MSRARALLAAACATGGVLLSGQATSPLPAQATEGPGGISDPEVRRIHARMMEAMGGEAAWERTRYLAFDWIVGRPGREPVRRSHRWDRWTGRYRVLAPSAAGELMALFDVDRPREGRAWLDGEAVGGPRADSLLDRAHAIFINDSYWLLMPYKWTDPGVETRYLGRRTDEEGKAWEVVELTFEEGTGRTPWNIYHAWVNPETGLMERWWHFREAGADPLITDWTDWRPCGPVRMAWDRPFRSSDGRIRFEGVRCETEVPEGAFAAPGREAGG